MRGVGSDTEKTKEDEENGIGDTRSRRRFEIYGLSGTSAGALNAFMVWYGMMLKDGQKGGFAEARKAMNNLWDTFQVRKAASGGSTCSANKPIGCKISASTSGRNTHRTSLIG